MNKLDEFITKAIDGLSDEEWDKLHIAVQSYARFCMIKLIKKLEDDLVINPDCYHPDDLYDSFDKILRENEKA